MGSVRGGGELQPGRLAGIGAASNSIDPMEKPDLSDSELAKSGLANSDLVKQAISFVEDFTAFAGLNGVWAAALAVIAAAFEGIGLLLLVPLLSIVTAADGGAGWTHRFIAQALDAIGAQTRNRATVHGILSLGGAKVSCHNRPGPCAYRPGPHRRDQPRD
jgi:hypothetical protein